MSLDAERIAALLTTRRFARSLDVRATTGSTNDDARAAVGIPDGHVILADAQRSGRGAHGHRWSSPPGTDLYFSIALSGARFVPATLPPLTLAVGLGVALACEQITGETFNIKWPNDVRRDGLKCAGILVESVSIGARLERVVIGVGVDVNRTGFAELAGVATSLRRVCGRILDREQVFATVVGHIEIETDRFIEDGASAIVPRVERRLAWLGEQVRCDDRRGVLEGLLPDGALLIDGTAVRSGTLRRSSEP